MARMDQSDHTKILDSYYRWAKITALYPDDDTADITILDADENPTSETHSAVPIFYHCDPDVSVRTNGALAGAAAAFAIDDKVIIKFEDGAPLVIARKDGLRACLKGLPIVYPTTYNFIGPEDPPGGDPEYEVSGIVRQLDADGFRDATENELAVTEIEVVVPSLTPPLTVQFYINDFEITDFLWKSGVWLATTGIPATWKISVIGAVDTSDYDKRIKLQVRYTYQGSVRDYEYEPLQLTYGIHEDGNDFVLPWPCEGITLSTWALIQYWGYDARYFFNNRLGNGSSASISDWVTVDAGSCTPPERLENAGAGLGYTKNATKNAYLQWNTLHQYLSACCNYLWAEDNIDDVPWPDTFQITFDALAGTELGDLIDLFDFRTKWEETFPLVQDLTFDAELTQWYDRPY